MEQAEITARISEAIAPHGDVTAAYAASGLHPSQAPLEAGWGKGPGRILLAARDEFFRVGYHGTSTRDIATAAGMSATAMYAHYSSKEAMLFKLCLYGSGSALEALRNAASGSAPPSQRLRAAVYAFAFWHAQNHVLGRVAQWNITALEPQSFQIIASLRRETEAEMRKILVDGVEAGEFVVADLAGTTLAMLSLCIDIGRWYPSRTIHVPEQIASTYVALAEAMVMPRRPA
jgi:AcrR family transcriptional regulator